MHFYSLTDTLITSELIAKTFIGTNKLTPKFKSS